MALIPTPTELRQIVSRTDPKLLQDQRLLRLFFTHPLPYAPEYLATIFQYLEVHVNFLYQDPLFSLLSGIKDVLGKVTLPPEPECPPTSSATATSYLQTLHQELEIPQFYLYPVVRWKNGNQQLVRPVEIAPQGTLQEDALLLTIPKLETFFENSRQFLTILLEYGLDQEQLHYLTPLEQGRYLTPLLELFRMTRIDRIRRFALNYLFQLIPLGVELYHDLLFDTLHDLMRVGSIKTLADPLDSNINLSRNFDRITDFLTAWLWSGFDINYQYAPVLTFAEAYGVPTQESLNTIQVQTVKYTGCSVLALAVIYNRADVVSWLLQFCGVMSLDPEEEELFARVLDLTNPVEEVTDEVLDKDKNYTTLSAVLRTKKDGKDEQEEKERVCESGLFLDESDDTSEWTLLDLAKRHRSTECERQLIDYSSHEKEKFDPLIHDARKLVYQF